MFHETKRFLNLLKGRGNQLSLLGNFPLDKGCILRLECLREGVCMFARSEVNRFTDKFSLTGLHSAGAEV
jgi:hypothetical protein